MEYKVKMGAYELPRKGSLSCCCRPFISYVCFGTPCFDVNFYTDWLSRLMKLREKQCDLVCPRINCSDVLSRQVSLAVTQRKWQTELQILETMGFSDVEQLAALLEKEKGDISSIIDQIQGPVDYAETKAKAKTEDVPMSRNAMKKAKKQAEKAAKKELKQEAQKAKTSKTAAVSCEK
jgi:hypothetical protein